MIFWCSDYWSLLHNIYNLAPYSHPWSDSLRVTWDAVSQAQSLKNSHWIKHNCDGFELWCWRRLLRVPWIARRSNQSILKEISPKCSLKGLMLKLKLQYFGHLTQRADSFAKTLMLGMIEDWRQAEKGTTEDEMVGMASSTQWRWVWVDSVSWWWTGRPGMLWPMRSRRVRHDWVTQLSTIRLWIFLKPTVLFIFTGSR